jgi:BolA family transcriptional regulator, general stress-responsive regulator
MGPIGLRIQSKLAEALSPRTLEVIDESNQHHGHAGAHPSGESHFRIRISSTLLDGKSRVAQHRTINDILKEELAGRVHALAIEVV